MFVEVCDLSISYGSIEVFAGLNARFPSRALTALIGPSGSGKSSLLAMISGNRRPTHGSVHYVLDSGDRIEPSQKLIAWIPQGANALPRRTAMDNVLIGALGRGLALRDARHIAITQLVNVGLGDCINIAARLLSGGELQRLALARALAMDCPILIADEPTANLDARNTELVLGTLQKMEWNCTVIVATHDPSIKNVADHVVALR